MSALESARTHSEIPADDAVCPRSDPDSVGAAPSDDLDWLAFCALHFRGARERHDFEAAVAYGDYRSSVTERV